MGLTGGAAGTIAGGGATATVVGLCRHPILRAIALIRSPCGSARSHGRRRNTLMGSATIVELLGQLSQPVRGSVQCLRGILPQLRHHLIIEIGDHFLHLSSIRGNAASNRSSTFLPKFSNRLPLLSSNCWSITPHFCTEIARPITLIPALYSASYEQLFQTDPKYGNDSGAYGEKIGAALLRRATLRVYSDGIFATRPSTRTPAITA